MAALAGAGWNDYKGKGKKGKGENGGKGKRYMGGGKSHGKPAGKSLNYCRLL